MSSSKTNPLLKLLSDENVPRKVVESLKKHDFDLKLVPAGLSDDEVSALAISEGRVFLTFDKHFSDPLKFPPEKHFGIVFIRVRPPLAALVTATLLELFRSIKSSELKGKLLIVSPVGFRVFPKGKLSES